MATITARLSRRMPLRGTSGIWIVTGLVSALASVLVLTWHQPSTPPLPIHMPWWLLAAAFAIVEAFVVHVQFGRETESFSLSEIPLVLGLFFVSPRELVIAQVVGAAIALAIVRRQATVKLVYNLAHFALTAVVAAMIFRAVLGSNPATGAHGWAAAFSASMAAMVIGVAMVLLAISLIEGRRQTQMAGRVLWMGAVVAGTNTSLALVGVSIVDTLPSAAWLLAVPAATLFFAYRSYTSQRQQNVSLQLLYESTRSLQGSLKVEETMHTLLSQARGMLRADVARVTLFATADDAARRTTLGPGERFDAMRVVTLDPTQGVWARVAAEGQGMVVARPITNERLDRFFAADGIRDAVVTPLRGEGGAVVGTLLVGNRLDDVSTFGDEDLKLLEMLANHASTAIENARLVGRLEENLAHMTELNRLKDDFVATVSHELRTPLTSIQGYVKTMLRDDIVIDEDDRRAYLDIVERQGQRLGRLIEDLLVVARIENEPFDMALGMVSLKDVARQAVEELGENAAGRLIDVIFDDAAPQIYTDGEKVHRILSNLLENAVKYSEPTTPITISGRIEAAGLIVSVEDRGIGIPSELAERVFDRFYQVDSSATRTAGGTGLGLYICRGLAEALGGRLWLERSDQNGRGSVFSFWLPARKPERANRPSSVAGAR
ncbi:MAG TPA: ATP-binding protein [Actinomycetota bacterium]|nr:ATP-binding protein [Actinomycetota bacterium]